MMNGEVENPVIRVTGLRTLFGQQVVHDGVSFAVNRGEVVGLVGGSGTGKSVLLREIVGLMEPTSGTVEVLGRDTRRVPERERIALQARWGMLFQDGALFSSLTVLENIQVPLKEHTSLSRGLIEEIARIKVAMVGLPPDAGYKYPSQLSGGMRKRAGLARALAMDPEILFLDEPTAGLDPIGANAFDELIGGLRKSLGLTVLMVTHDLDSLYAICDRIAVLVDKKVMVGTMDFLLGQDHPWIHDYFHGPRGRAAGAARG